VACVYLNNKDLILLFEMYYAECNSDFGFFFLPSQQEEKKLSELCASAVKKF